MFNGNDHGGTNKSSAKTKKDRTPQSRTPSVRQRQSHGKPSKTKRSSDGNRT